MKGKKKEEKKEKKSSAAEKEFKHGFAAGINAEKKKLSKKKR